MQSCMYAIMYVNSDPSEQNESEFFNIKLLVPLERAVCVNFQEMSRIRTYANYK